MPEADVRVVALAGSLRRDSYNRKLLRIGIAAAEQAGAEVIPVDLRDYPLPFFDEDFESERGLPENGRRLKDLFLKADALLIANPEYNSSLSGVLKNAIDWISRPVEGYPPLECFINKVATIMSASPGNLGGLRSLADLRSILSNMRVTVLPEQVSVPSAHEAFNDDGSLKDEKRQQAIESLAEKLVLATRKLKA